MITTQTHVPFVIDKIPVMIREKYFDDFKKQFDILIVNLNMLELDYKFSSMLQSWGYVRLIVMGIFKFEARFYLDRSDKQQSIRIYETPFFQDYINEDMPKGLQEITNILLKIIKE